MGAGGTAWAVGSASAAHADADGDAVALGLRLDLDAVLEPDEREVERLATARVRRVGAFGQVVAREQQLLVTADDPDAVDARRVLERFVRVDVAPPLEG
ncbi:hypothetical protein SY89_02773 [Halolamina pelagica]|uniref:Uncharacterized protein n=1 Tax=Halolamina pelagica TaxID=699431 RepID=A0A0P7FXP9_9EURY|nr:hypothetical protein SY89_02773 [Halolamina pelagica]